MELIVIGAGASGLMAAITAAKNGCTVTILEHKDRAGKKILATGNGRCNFTNRNMSINHYNGSKELIEHGLSVFDENSSIDFFNKLGVISKDKNGYMYPNSNQATTILNALLDEVARLKINLITECEIQNIQRLQKTNNFKVITTNGKFVCNKIIISTGLLASPKLGSDGKIFKIIKNLGHHFTPIVPALCGFKCKNFPFKKVAGVRTDAKVYAMIDNTQTADDLGELQLTDYGISGIPVFQISRHLSMGLYEKKDVKVRIDFMPEYQINILYNLILDLANNFNNSKTWENLLSGLLNSKLSIALLEEAGINPKEVVHIDKKNIQKLDRLCEKIKSLEVIVCAYRDYEFAQVCAGGIKSSEINLKTLESNFISGLYFAGELLDVDGICGGYNLQWAWTSGYIAGNSVSI